MEEYKSARPHHPWTVLAGRSHRLGAAACRSGPPWLHARWLRRRRCSCWRTAASVATPSRARFQCRRRCDVVGVHRAGRRGCPGCAPAGWHYADAFRVTTEGAGSRNAMTGLRYLEAAVTVAGDLFPVLIDTPHLGVVGLDDSHLFFRIPASANARRLRCNRRLTGCTAALVKERICRMLVDGPRKEQRNPGAYRACTAPTEPLRLAPPSGSKPPPDRRGQPLHRAEPAARPCSRPPPPSPVLRPRGQQQVRTGARPERTARDTSRDQQQKRTFVDDRTGLPVGDPAVTGHVGPCCFHEGSGTATSRLLLGLCRAPGRRHNGCLGRLATTDLLPDVP